jgi:membrane-bound lytic murein transglycosylase D
MIYTKFFTVLAAIVCGIGVFHAHASEYKTRYEMPASEKIFSSLADTTILSQEEMNLLIEYIPNEPNDIIKDRLSCIESEIPLTFNPFVRNFVDYFTIRNRKYTRMMISRENLYFPLFEKYLKKHNMPDELKYLAIVESGLKPTAVSHAGAAGLWQFMKPTGKDYGLTQTSYLDERLDPEKSTEAACRFLKQLHRSFGDWELALAAYNCGPGNVRKAIKKAGGGTKTFWEVFPYLPKETRGYVPSMTAVIYTMNYAPEHNIFSDSILYAVDTEKLMINHAVDLEKLAEELHVAPATLFALNPEIKEKVLPENIRNYPLRIPSQRKNFLASASDLECALAAAKPVPATNLGKAPAAEPVIMAARPPATASPSTEKIVSAETTHTVQRGDNLTQIARQYNITVADLMEWNSLDNSNIKADQKLIIRTASTEAAVLVSAEPTEKAIKTSSVTAKADVKQKKVEQTASKSFIHQVEVGDTLWNISQKYDGITVEQIKKLNKLKSNAIKPGQQLILS